MASSRDLVRDEYTVAGSERTTGYYNIMRTYLHIREEPGFECEILYGNKYRININTFQRPESRQRYDSFS